MSKTPPNTHLRVLIVDRVEDRIPGRAAFVMHRGRTVGRLRTIDGMRLLEAWARRRAERLSDQRTPDPGIDLRDEASAAEDAEVGSTDGGGSRNEASQDAYLAEVARPDESWTKGRIYELARELELEGRSKLDKAELLEAVLEVLDEREDLAGPETPVYGHRPETADVSV